MGAAADVEHHNQTQPSAATIEAARAQGLEVTEDGKIGNVAGHGQLATDAYGNPLVTFDPAAESRLRWKMDLFTVPTVFFLYLFCFIDRVNIGNARLAGLQEDLGMPGKWDYNTVVSIFYISYIIFEIPATICCKWMGPGWFLPITTIGFGIVSICTGYVHTKAQLCGVRFLLGIFEAGMLPGVAYYLSRWYQRAELSFRLALYMVAAPLAGAFGALLASGILHMDSFAGTTRWRMIFVVEGIITVCLGAVSFLTLTDRPETARWLNEEEKALCIARVKSERVGQTEVIDGIDKIKLIRGMTSPVTLEIAFIFLFNNITVQGMAFFLPTIVRTLHKDASVIRQQLLCVPPWALGAVFTLVFPFISWRIDRRQLLIAASAPLVMCGYAMFLGSDSLKVRYGATFFIASSAMVLGPMSNAQISANIVSDTARTSAIGLNVMFGNIGGLIASWSYPGDDGPNFPIGNSINLAAASTILVLSILAYFWMLRDNRKRDLVDVDAALEGLSSQEIQDLDWKHPGFRWRP